MFQAVSARPSPTRFVPVREATHPVRSIALVLFSVALLLVAMQPPAARAGDWQGKEAKEDGVLQVYNPATGMEKPQTIDLEEVFRLGGYDDEDNLFGVITSVIADEEGNFYMLDAQLSEIKVYSPDGEWLRTIGREGEGPGEFRRASAIFLVPGGNIGVLQTFPSKIVLLTPEGDPAGDFPLPEQEGAGFRVLFGAAYAGDKLAIVYGRNQPSEGSFTQTNVLSLVSADGKNESVLFTDDSTMDFASAVIAEKEWDSFRNRWTAAPDGRVFTVRTFGTYEITVWNNDGSIDRVIHREYPVHKRTQEDHDRILDIYKGFTRQIPIPNIKYEIEENFNPIAQMYARADGSLWVQTSRGQNDRPEGVLGGFDIFDSKGHFVQTVNLKGTGDPWVDGYFFAGDYLFVVTDWLPALMALQSGGATSEDEEVEEEPEPMQVICYRINGARLGMR
jgi:hypothetical protein